MKKNTKILLITAIVLCTLLALYFLLPKGTGEGTAGTNTTNNTGNTGNSGNTASSETGTNSGKEGSSSSSKEKEGTSSPAEATIQEDQGDIIITIPDDQQSGGE